MTKKLINGILVIIGSFILMRYYYNGFILAKNNHFEPTYHKVISCVVFSLGTLGIFCLLIYIYLLVTLMDHSINIIKNTQTQNYNNFATG